MANLNHLTTSWQNATSPLLQRFNALSRRDQFALLILATFLILFVVGYGGWSLHQKANATQKAYDDTMSDVFWLRSQAGNINPNQAQVTNKTDLIKQILTQTGINAQIVENGDTLQVNFTHDQAGIVSNIFNQFSQQGITIKQLQINQPSPNKLDVQAVLSLK